MHVSGNYEVFPERNKGFPEVAIKYFYVSGNIIMLPEFSKF